jgi:hypothetical protein
VWVAGAAMSKSVAGFGAAVHRRGAVTHVPRAASGDCPAGATDLSTLTPFPSGLTASCVLVAVATRHALRDHRYSYTRGPHAASIAAWIL